MCLPFCMPRAVDDDPAPVSRTRNGGSHYNGNGYPAHSRAAAEADRKASNDVRRGTAHHAGATAAAPRGWHGHAPATAAQEKAAAYPYPYTGADGTLKQQPAAAWNGKVAADGHGARGGAPHNYYEHAHPPAHRYCRSPKVLVSSMLKRRSNQELGNN